MDGHHCTDAHPIHRTPSARSIFILASWIFLFFSSPGAADAGGAEPLRTRGVELLTSLQGVAIHECDPAAVLSHDPGSFTQGLAYHGGVFYESTGLWGSSSLRQVEVNSGKALKRRDVPRQYFAEGLTVFKGKIYQLTWKSRKCFIYDPDSFQKIGEAGYTGEGWGLTHDGEFLIMSDGTDRLRFIEPKTFRTTRIISAHHRGKPLKMLNELEYVRGEILANIWGADVIARLDPRTGEVLGLIDISSLYDHLDAARRIDVANGIAWDKDSDRLWVTGKLWPKIFQIRLIPAGRVPEKQ